LPLATFSCFVRDSNKPRFQNLRVSAYTRVGAYQIISHLGWALNRGWVLIRGVRLFEAIRYKKAVIIYLRSYTIDAIPTAHVSRGWMQENDRIQVSAPHQTADQRCLFDQMKHDCSLFPM